MGEQTMETQKKVSLTKKDLNKAYWTFETYAQACCSYERLQAPGFFSGMRNIIDKLYDDDPEQKAEACQRHMDFYNSEFALVGPVILGASIAMEEEKANGADIDGQAISAIKTSLMGPLAGIGDSVMNSLIEVVLMSIAMTFAFQGNLFGPVFYLVTWVAASLIISWFLINRGYKLGINSLSVMSDSVMGRLVEALTQIGLMVIGGLSATYVAVSTPLVIAGSGGADDTVVQAILDNILPNLLPLGLVGLCYWLMTKKKCSPIVLILILFVLGTVLSVLGILG